MKKNEFVEGGIQRISGIMVSKNAPSWEKFRFISGAKSKDQTRFFMTGIHIERVGNKTLLISTDGRRLHIATVESIDIEPGDYQVKEKTRDFMVLYPWDEEIDFPNWRNIVKGLNTQKHIKLDLKAKDKASFSQTLYGLYKSTDAVINFEYLEPLANASEKWDVYFNEAEKSLTFTSCDLMAIIMPMAKAKDIAVEETKNAPDFRDITPEPKKLGLKPLIRARSAA